LDDSVGKVVTNLWSYLDVGHTDEAAKELKNIFGEKPFSTPKPTRLLKRILSISSPLKSFTILDFFAGSGTTLHATMKLNDEDGGKRQCILVTNNENNICEGVTYVRNKKVIEGYTTPKGEKVAGLTANNLRYYKTDFISREKTVRNMRNLVSAATELLCIKNDVYIEQSIFGGHKLKSSAARYFDDGKKQMLVIFNESTVDAFADVIKEMRFKKKLLIYVFSHNRYAYTDNFIEVLDKVELCALPAAIYDAYNRVLPAKKEEQAEEAFIEDENHETGNTETIAEGGLL
jgi:adenine-specific DNA-methyltransferase